MKFRVCLTACVLQFLLSLQAHAITLETFSNNENAGSVRTKINNNAIATESSINSIDGSITTIESDITDIQADIADIYSEQNVEITGLLALPTVTATPATNTVTVGAVDGKVVKNGLIADWSLPANSQWVYDPVAMGTRQYSVLTIEPDWTTEGTTNNFKLREYLGYKQIEAIDAEHVGMVIGVVFDGVSGNNHLNGTTFKYVSSPRGTSLAYKISGLLTGSELIRNYQLSPEFTPAVGATGSFFAQGAGSAKTFGRGTSQNIYQTHTVLGDTARQGGESSQVIVVTGLGTEGNEGQLFYRTPAGQGSTARVLSGQAPMYEPTPAQTTADFVAVPANSYACYLLGVFPGSKIMLNMPPKAVYNAFQTAIDAADGVAGTHQYLKQPYTDYDRWLHVIGMNGELGFLCLKGDFNPLVDWTANAGKYKFYTVNGTERTF